MILNTLLFSPSFSGVTYMNLIMTPWSNRIIRLSNFTNRFLPTLDDKSMKVYWIKGLILLFLLATFFHPLHPPWFHFTPSNILWKTIRQFRSMPQAWIRCSGKDDNHDCCTSNSAHLTLCWVQILTKYLSGTNLSEYKNSVEIIDLEAFKRAL